MKTVSKWPTELGWNWHKTSKRAWLLKIRSGYLVLKQTECNNFNQRLYALNSVAWVRERTIPTERPPLDGEINAIFADRGCHVVRVTDPYGRILGCLHRSRYFFFQVAPQLYSRGFVDPVSDPLLLRKSSSAGIRIRASGSVESSSAGIRTRTSGSVARNSDH
jgi:hypothetical protein